MAIVYRQRVDDDTEFALWKIEEQAEDLYNQLQLNDSEKAFVEQISNGKRHLHWLGTRVLLRKMLLTDESWLAVRTTQGVTSFVGAGNKPTPISEAEVNSIVKFTTQGAMPTFKEVFMIDDTVKIIDGPFADFIGKVDSVDTEKGRLRVLVSIFGRETPVELDFLQVTKL